MDNRPIGVLDSGVGGFTVLKELQKYLPNEPTIYFGDSKNMPYGEKSNEEIVACVNDAIRFLESQNVKCILLACNTASSLISELKSTVPLFSIVEAGIQAVERTLGSGTLGLIATRATVKNDVYPRLAREHGDQIHFISYGTPTLAAVINNHPHDLKVLRENIAQAVDPILEQESVHHLLLGCTHFPIVSKTIQEMYPQLRLINPALRQSEILQDFLKENQLEGEGPMSKIFVTGSAADYYLSRRMLDELQLYYQTLDLVDLTDNLE